MPEITNQNNNNADFDQLVRNKLQCYVYVLRDPRDRKVFYVGKAGGSGEGNQRVLDHFEEAEKALKEQSSPRSPKVQRIIEIWSADERVEWFIVRYGLDKPTALHVEATLIDGYGISQNGPTLNRAAGHGQANHSLLSSEDIYALSATPVNPNTRYPFVFIFPIHNALAQDRSVYDATRRYWTVSQRLRQLFPALAIGIDEGISKGVFDINHWSNTGLPPKKWEFESNTKAPIPNHELDNKNWLAIISSVMGYWQQGNYLVVEFDGNGNFKFIRGNSDKTTWFPL